MRKLALSILVVLSIAPLFGQEVHQAADLHELLARIHAGVIHEALSSVTVDAVATPFAAMTLNITVPSNDQSSGGIGHGFFLENYFENFGFFITRGQTRTVTFVANQAG